MRHGYEDGLLPYVEGTFDELLTSPWPAGGLIATDASVGMVMLVGSWVAAGGELDAIKAAVNAAVDAGYNSRLDTFQDSAGWHFRWHFIR